MRGNDAIMIELIRVAVEENPKGIMIHLIDMPGAFTRAEKLSDAISKIVGEAKMYASWVGKTYQQSAYKIEIVQKETTQAQLDDGDTEILTLRDKNFDASYFQHLKMLALKSAEDFQKLYDSLPNKEFIDITKNRTTFYGKIPSNAKEMLFHVDEVKTYYLSRINISFSEEESDFVSDRYKSIRLIESGNQACCNQLFFVDDEYWTTAKVLRRFIWHDRIHARALYRFAVKIWGYTNISNVFSFETPLSK